MQSLQSLLQVLCELYTVTLADNGEHPKKTTQI